MQQFAIVVTIIPASNTQGVRYKAVSTQGVYIAGHNPALETNANAHYAANALCVQLEHTTGTAWGVVGPLMDNPAKAGSYIAVAKRK